MPDKVPFTKAECLKWLEDKSRNPRTGRKINPDVKGGIYSELERQCNEGTQSATKVLLSATQGATKGIPNSTKENQNAFQDSFDAYCRCLMKVRPTIKGKSYEKAVYAICNKSVLKSKKINTRPKYCDYNFEDFTDEQLLSFADELEHRKKWDWKLSQKARDGDRKAIVAELKKLQKHMKETYDQSK